MRILGAFFVLFAWPAFSATKLVSQSNYFYRVDAANTTEPVTLYGGTTGTCVSADHVTPCNSCALSATQWGYICNDHEIDPNLQLNITLTSDRTDVIYGQSCTQSIYLSSSGGATARASTVLTTTNSNVTGTFKWSDVCQALNGDPLCSTSFSKTLNVGFDTDCSGTGFGDSSVQMKIIFRAVSGAMSSWPQDFGCLPSSTLNDTYQGFCNFTVFPGDEKVFIHNATINALNSYQVSTGPASTTADPSGMHYRALRVFYSPSSDPATLTPQSPYTDLQVGEDGNLDHQTITDLTNDQNYIFGTANVDDGGNVTFYMDKTGAHGTVTFTVGTQSNGTLGQTQAAKPEAVYGLIDGKKCLVTTAALGSNLMPKLDLLRQFRSQILTKIPGGSAFIRWYYRNSPTLAAWLNDHPVFKPVVRGFVWPAVWVTHVVFETQRWLSSPQTLVSR